MNTDVFLVKFSLYMNSSLLSRGEKRLPEICLRLQATCSYFQIFYVTFFETFLIMVMFKNAPLRSNFQSSNNY